MYNPQVTSFCFLEEKKMHIYTRAYDKFPDFFCMGTFIDSTHMKL